MKPDLLLSDGAQISFRRTSAGPRVGIVRADEALVEECPVNCPHCNCGAEWYEDSYYCTNEACPDWDYPIDEEGE